MSSISPQEELVLAIKAQNLVSLQAAIDEGANVNLPDDFGRTPLLEACRYRHLDILKTLLAAGAEPNQANKYTTPLLSACHHAHLDIVEALLAVGAKPDQADQYGETPLLVACRTGNFDIVKTLLAAGAKPDQANHDGNRPLFVACRTGHLDIVEDLLAAGANPNHANQYGDIILDTISLENETSDALLSMVIRAGANPLGGESSLITSPSDLRNSEATSPDRSYSLALALTKSGRNLLKTCPETARRLRYLDFGALRMETLRHAWVSAVLAYKFEAYGHPRERGYTSPSYAMDKDFEAYGHPRERGYRSPSYAMDN